MKAGLFAAVLLVSSAFTAPVLAATSVAANLSTPTFVGTFGPGTYNVTGSGLIDLVGPPGSGFTMRPDGTPDSPIVAPGYGYFNPSGSFLADGSFGPGGSTIKIGALMGTFTATPGSPSDYFLIGFGTTLSFASTTSLYAQVNDTFYPNNGGAFSVDVRSAVPEPATWAMMIGGFGIAGAAIRRRRVTFARAA